ncbi:hypothetical protein [Rhodovulum euryhalinum]|uniref:Uncharacterized protein n=1 Tax=Rhodovulum euryhalinum TaxID=35805 RepID=A0A4R2KL88_9RHOB|nr:hypothetical protein [Rhodovulum euryhalinum]TCO70788.1 hypothetical protein EV655_10829 [Rhodovulum euryhalinum]
MNWKAIAALGAVAALGIGGYVLFGYVGATRSATIGKILADNGFTEFKPPTQSALPGTLVLVTGTDPVALGVVCRPEQALGLTLAEIPVSPSASSDLSAVLNRTLVLDAGLLARLKAGGKLAGVRDIRITLTNVRVLELSDDDVIRRIANRDPACAQAVRMRLDAGQPLTMIKAALMADVTYTATSRTDADGEVSLDLREELAASLKSSVTASDGGTITLAGQDLVWGIRDDQVLAMLGSVLSATGTESAGLEERPLLAGGAVVESFAPVD